ELKKHLAGNPEDEALRERLRQRDLEIRKEYYRSRRRFVWAGYLLLLGLAAFIASVRWFFSLSPAAGEIVLPSQRPSAPPRRYGAIAAGVVAALGLAVLTYLGVFHRPVLPPADWEEQAVAAVWPCFRGPGNIGVAGSGDFPTTWSATTDRNIVWKVEVPASGKSSPVVWGDRIFLSGANEAELRVVCFDRASGAVLWNSRAVAPQGTDEKAEVFEDTGFAAPTPVTDGKRVYAMFGTGLLAAFDLEGRRAWTKHLGAPENAYGFASSLMLHENVVILQFDQGAEAKEGKSRLLGFEASTGRILWETPRPAPNSWASPALIQTPERAELITCADPWIIAYDPASGAELWRVDGLYGDVAPSPTFGGGVVFVTNDSAQILAIRPGGSGDVTKTRVLWTFDEGMPDIASPVTDGRRVLQVAAGGMLTCINAETGELLWEEYLDSAASSSPILAGDLVYLTCEDGATRIFRLAEKFEVLSRGELGEPVYATPAFVDSRIYVRGAKHLFCIGQQSAP
ncbi:MAG TPA: PQQ-binding-like beta-propeller repeat protein, partial [Sumerlaeia bacterium]|nr:PQQ-binding-like beta-propeller repeat protein [Sumerlaeia bacterium]